MTILDFLNQIKESPEYVNNSLLLKSVDNYGCVYKCLVHHSNTATRIEYFVELDIAEAEVEFLNKTVISYIEVVPAK